MSMNPSTAIAPRTIVRRQTAKRWHLWDFHGDDGERTYCGQNIRWAKRSTAFYADKITCTDCLVAAISRGGAR